MITEIWFFFLFFKENYLLRMIFFVLLLFISQRHDWLTDKFRLSVASKEYNYCQASSIVVKMGSALLSHVFSLSTSHLVD